ncbi:MAG: hypothetical protein C0617_11845 [Desulfuromonas sp.]|uniref:hypothetical protein n=1 Tax=Desulfuromonas sp. TaxID=892 RepID=UPI000CB72C1D|nr:hypothetical protein [Desulfuromonas sp.]PLX83222.1 MAG: hypothetical protein C0617_11845 [Desulfuromonas sp.]
MAATSCAGFSYVEVLVATVLVAVALVPIGEALQEAVSGAYAGEAHAVGRHRLEAKLEEVLAEPFSALEHAAAAAGGAETASSYSDDVTVAERRLVYLAPYDADDADGDADPFTGGDEGVIWVQVAIEDSGQSLETLTSGH